MRQEPTSSTRPAESRVVKRPSYARVSAALDWLFSLQMPPEVEAEEEPIQQSARQVGAAQQDNRGDVLT